MDFVSPEQDGPVTMPYQAGLFESLYRYAMLVGIISCLQHFVVDGFMSMPFLTAICYLLCAHYRCSPQDRFARFQARKAWRSAYTENLLRNFSLTILSMLRVIFLSLHESEVDDTVAVFLAYIQLLIAFTDNLTFCCEIEDAQLSRHVHDFRLNRRPMAAAAA
ncbi:hypothetical protein Q1695_011175 [Nippostrongylus brasiliensis]|nr:hypothetical protein Q1695_011175 [Nippostrongylus brasiliensis]